MSQRSLAWCDSEGILVVVARCFLHVCVDVDVGVWFVRMMLLVALLAAGVVFEHAISRLCVRTVWHFVDLVLPARLEVLVA